MGSRASLGRADAGSDLGQASTECGEPASRAKAAPADGSRAARRMEASSKDLAAANRPASGSNARRGTPLRDQNQW